MVVLLLGEYIKTLKEKQIFCIKKNESNVHRLLLVNHL